MYIDFFMKKKIIIFTFFLILFVSVVFSIKLWLRMDFVDISTNGLIAIIICVIVSLILGIFLMALAFFSSRFGFDDQVDHNLESIIEKHKKL